MFGGVGETGMRRREWSAAVSPTSRCSAAMLRRPSPKLGGLARLTMRGPVGAAGKGTLK